MSFKRLIILFVILSVFLSVNAISASADVGLNNTLYDSVLNSADTDIIEIQSSDEEVISNELLGVESNEQENSRVIYVGQNTNEGNGSYDNPFSSLQSACTNVTGKDKVTINILDGNIN